MSSHSGTIGRKRDYYLTGNQMRRQRSAEWQSRHGYSSSEDEYQNSLQNVGSFDTQLLASLLAQSQQLANIDRSYRSDCDNDEVTESLLTEYPQSYQQNIIMGSPQPPQKSSSRNPFAVKYEIHPPTRDPERISFSGSSAVLDRLQAAELNLNSSASANLSSTNASLTGNGNSGIAFGGNNGNSGTTHLQTNIIVNPTSNGTLRSSRSKSGRLNRISGMTSSSSATSSNSNPANRSERERREKLREQQQQQQLQLELKEPNDDLSELDKNIFEPPPEPAPPEIPPRTQSLLTSIIKRSDYQLKYEENGDLKHEEFIPQSQQKDYLMVTDNSRSSEFPSKSITSSDSQSQQG